MTRVMRGTGRALVLAGLATVTAAALTACGSGQVTQTSDQVAPVPGYSVSEPVPGGGKVGIRNTLVAFKVGGYAKGSDAPLQLYIFNETASAVDVQITSADAASVVLAGKVGEEEPAPAESPSAAPSASAAPSTSTGPSASAAPSVSASPKVEPSPKAPVGKPAKINVPAASYASLAPGTGSVVVLRGLTRDLKPGEAVKVTFAFSNGVTFENAGIPLGVPLTPLPRIEGVKGE